MRTISSTSSMMDLQSQSEIQIKEINHPEPTPNVGNVSKYNLRANRNISEKMTKKDFVYDMRQPHQSIKKRDRSKQKTYRLPLKLLQNEYSNAIMTYSLMSKADKIGGDGDAPMLSKFRDLKFRCNFCYEPIATLSSLSTHVKFHCLAYCKKCYWVLEEGETIEKHIEKAHSFSRK